LRCGKSVGPRRHDGFQGPFFVPHVALHALYQIRDQVVTSLELHVDLRKRIPVPIPAHHQAVVDDDAPQQREQDNAEDDKQDYCTRTHGWTPSFEGVSSRLLAAEPASITSGLGRFYDVSILRHRSGAPPSAFSFNLAAIWARYLATSWALIPCRSRS